LDGAVGPRRRSRRKRLSRGADRSGRRRRPHALQRHFASALIGDVDGRRGLIAYAADDVFVRLEDTRRFGCHSFQPAVAKVRIEFKSGAFDLLFAGVFAFANIFGAEVFDRFGLIHLLFAD